MRIVETLKRAATTASFYLMVAGQALATGGGHGGHGGHGGNGGGSNSGGGGSVPEMDAGQALVIVAIVVGALLLLRERMMRAASATK